MDTLSIGDLIRRLQIAGFALPNECFSETGWSWPNGRGDRKRGTLVVLAQRQGSLRTANELLASNHGDAASAYELFMRVLKHLTRDTHLNIPGLTTGRLFATGSLYANNGSSYVLCANTAARQISLLPASAPSTWRGMTYVLYAVPTPPRPTRLAPAA